MESDETIIIVSNTLSASKTEKSPIRHPLPIPDKPQVVAKNHVTLQQIGNALSTLVCLLETRIQYHLDRKLRFTIRDRLYGSTNVMCPLCGTECAKGFITITHCQRIKDPLTCTHIEMHCIMEHGSPAFGSASSLDWRRFVELLDLKPNVCYVPKGKYVLEWHFENSFRGPLINEDVAFAKMKLTKRFGIPKNAHEVFTRKQDRLSAIVYDHGGFRYLLLSYQVDESQWIIRVEGASIITTVCHPADNVYKYRLVWKWTLVTQDWFCI